MASSATSCARCMSSRWFVAASLGLLAGLQPAWSFADGEWSVGVGLDKGGLGGVYEFKGRGLTPQVGIGVAGFAAGANYYLSDKTKGDMPAGWRVRGTVGVIWTGDFVAGLTGGQRTGNWHWDVGPMIIGDQFIVGTQWGFHF